MPKTGDSSRRSGRLVCACALGLIVVPISLAAIPGKVAAGWERIVSQEDVSDHKTVQKLKEWQDHVDWLYTEQPILAFHARIPVPPELAVVSVKRQAAGQVDEGKILDIVKNRAPEVVLPPLDPSPEWKHYLESKYEPLDKERYPLIMVRKDIRLPGGG